MSFKIHVQLVAQCNWYIDDWSIIYLDILGISIIFALSFYDNFLTGDVNWAEFRRCKEGCLPLRIWNTGILGFILSTLLYSYQTFLWYYLFNQKKKKQKESTIATTYTTNPRSMMQVIFLCSDQSESYNFHITCVHATQHDLFNG